MKKFKKTYIEITNACNLSCPFCPGTSRRRRFMEAALFEEILGKIHAVSEYLYFHVMGEPLLHPELGLFLDICQQRGFKVTLTTNGTLLDNAAGALHARPALRQVNISLQCLEACGPGDADGKYLDTILNFIAESRKTGGPIICLRLWNGGPTGAQDGLNGRLLRGLEERFRPGASIEEQLASGNDVTLADKIFLNLAPRFEWPGLERPDRGPAGFCLGLREQAAILVDGTVVPCCLDAEGVIKLGDIRRQSMEEILQGPRARRLFDGFSRRETVEQLCRRCGYRERFGRMRRPGGRSH